MTPETAVVQLLAVTGIVIFGYYLLVNGNYLFVHVMALLQLREEVREDQWDPTYEPFTTPFLPGIAIVVPAYDEASVIRESVQSLLTVNYPDKEVIVVNDGSTDDTLDRLRESYDLRRVAAEVPIDVPSETIRGVYRSDDRDDLLVVDKENGGKSDALNAGLWLTDKELFCAVDADSVVDTDSLLEIVRPFLEQPRSMVAVGGTVRVANDCTIEYGQVTEVSLDRAPLVAVQVMEYLRAFYSGRLGLSRLKGLILISGAFGLFRTQVVREIGGYREDTITEDFDLLVRLHRHLMQEDREYAVEFLPQPVIWTEVPESLAVLSRQRRRWYRGMVETLWTNRDMIGNPTYGRIGVYILPFFALAELLGPLIEGLGYLLIPLAVSVGALNVEFFVLYFVVTTGFGVFLSWFGVYSEVTSFRRYDDPRQILSLLGDGVLENFGYRQWKTYLAWRGLFEYLRGDSSWGVMDRAGFGAEETAGDGERKAADGEVTGAGSVTADTDHGFVWATPVAPDAHADETEGGWSNFDDTDGFVWGAGGDGFLWGVSRDGFRWGASGDGFLWGPTGDGHGRGRLGGGFHWGAGGDGFRWGTAGERDAALWATDGDGFVWAAPLAPGFQWVVGDGERVVAGLVPHDRPAAATELAATPADPTDDWLWGRVSSRDGFEWGLRETAERDPVDADDD